MTSAIVEKLQRLNQKIQNHGSMDQDLKNLIGIDLYGFFKDDASLNPLFFERANFLTNLSKDADFVKLQNELIDTMIQMLNIISMRDVRKVQKKEDKKIPLAYRPQRFSVPFRINALAPDQLPSQTLPELYPMMSNRENFNLLGDQNCVLTLDEFELSLRIHTGVIIRQYNSYLFFTDMFVKESGMRESDPERYKKYLILKEEYEKKYKVLKERLYYIGLKLHIKDFEEFLAIASCARPIDEWPFSDFHDWYRNYSWQQRERNNSIDRIKKTCSVVVEDLIDSLKLEEEDIQTPIIQSKAVRYGKLLFDPENGDISYKKESGNLRIGSKAYAIVCLLFEDKNTHFTISDLNKYGNRKVSKKKFCFKAEKDTEDALERVKEKLKIGKSAIFPIRKEDNHMGEASWIWHEK